MQHKLINTSDYLLIVDDSEIKEGDWYLNIEEKNGIKNPFYGKLYKANQSINKVPLDYLVNNLKKIISHLPLNNSPILEGVDLLPPLEDEVDKLARQFAIDESYGKISGDLFKGFIFGYNKAKEKYKYTEEDIKEAMNKIIGYAILFPDRIIWDKDIALIIQSLQQPKMPVGFKCEIEETINRLFHASITTKYQIKTTNSQGLTQWIGEYIY